MNLQWEAGLALLPYENSLDRVKQHLKCGDAPSGIGLKAPYSASVKIFNTRIENRLPGADADPFVAMAITMAAMVEALHARYEGCNIKEQKFSLPESHEQLVKIFQSSVRLKTLLGRNFYDQLLSVYMPSQVTAR